MQRAYYRTRDEGRLDSLAEPVENRSVLYCLACTPLVAGPVFAGSRSDGSGRRELLPRSDITRTPVRYVFFRAALRCRGLRLLPTCKECYTSHGVLVQHQEGWQCLGFGTCAWRFEQLTRRCGVRL